MPFGRLTAPAAPNGTPSIQHPASAPTPSAAPARRPRRMSPPIVFTHPVVASHRFPTARNGKQRTRWHRPHRRSGPSTGRQPTRALRATVRQTDSPGFSREDTSAKIDATTCYSPKREEKTGHGAKAERTPPLARRHRTQADRRRRQVSIPGGRRGGARAHPLPTQKTARIASPRTPPRGSAKARRGPPPSHVAPQKGRLGQGTWY